jgi:hypothetical protein
VSLKWLIPLTAIWALAAWGALCLEALPGELAHDWCGPWGCLPRLQALAAMHLFWVVVLIPPIAWALNSGRSGFLVLLGGVLFLGSGLTTAVLAGRDVLVWLSSMPPQYQVYWGRRALYTIVMFSDVPLIQLMLAGAVCWTVGRRSRERVLPSHALPPGNGRHDHKASRSAVTTLP